MPPLEKGAAFLWYGTHHALKLQLWYIIDFANIVQLC